VNGLHLSRQIHLSENLLFKWHKGVQIIEVLLYHVAKFLGEISACQKIVNVLPVIQGCP